jgi:hypothetical protein
LTAIEFEVEKPKFEGENPICWVCDRPALEHCYSDAGRQEVFISGLCEECFDKITGAEDGKGEPEW